MGVISTMMMEITLANNDENEYDDDKHEDEDKDNKVVNDLVFDTTSNLAVRCIPGREEQGDFNDDDNNNDKNMTTTRTTMTRTTMTRTTMTRTTTTSFLQFSRTR